MKPERNPNVNPEEALNETLNKFLKEVWRKPKWNLKQLQMRPMQKWKVNMPGSSSKLLPIFANTRQTVPGKKSTNKNKPDQKEAPKTVLHPFNPFTLILNVPPKKNNTT